MRLGHNVSEPIHSTHDQSQCSWSPKGPAVLASARQALSSSTAQCQIPEMRERTHPWHWNISLTALTPAPHGSARRASERVVLPTDDTWRRAADRPREVGSAYR